MIICDRQKLLDLADHHVHIIIYGSNNIGQTIYRFLKKNGRDKKVIGFSGNKLKTKGVSLFSLPSKTMDAYKEYKETALVLCCIHPKYQESAKAALEQSEFSNIADIDYELYCQLAREENVPLDFLCVGFTKCGTSSLQAALVKHPEIYLPKKKETNYIHWRRKYDDSPERHREKYYADTEGKRLLGDIEPTYHNCSTGVSECYGKDVKLIFMMRNPVDATYSYFKMRMRRTTYKKQVNYYKKYKKFDVNMFDLYINDYILSEEDKRFCYADYIEEYMKYYKPENIKFIFLEDVIKEPKKTMNEIQDFIGVKKRKTYKSLPHSNSGKEVSRNYISALINYYEFRYKLKLKGNTSSFQVKMQEKLHEKIKKWTLVENNEKITEHSRAVLTEYYKDSIQRLEKICGRSLEGIWY